MTDKLKLKWEQGTHCSPFAELANFQLRFPNVSKRSAQDFLQWVTDPGRTGDELLRSSSCSSGWR